MPYEVSLFYVSSTYLHPSVCCKKGNDKNIMFYAILKEIYLIFFLSKRFYLFI